MTQLIHKPNNENLKNIQLPFESTNDMLIQFDEEIRQNNFGPTAQVWQSFLDMAQVLLDYINHLELVIGNFICVAWRKCYLGFMPMTVSITHVISPTALQHFKSP